jgi:hypothetical protein
MATAIDVVDPTNITSKQFFDQYIRQRKPCVLDGLPLGKDGQPLHVSRQLLEDLAGDKVIQVEKRFTLEENFGQNRTSKRQVQLKIRDLLKALLDTDDGDNELYYWSTQEDTDDPYNVPCRQLMDHGHIPPTISQAGNLILSSCNLWMGASKEGASSGLHHDYHDNFYLLLQGRKRFRLLSPDCAPKLHVYGTIERIHPNGRVSYIGNETRADGVPLKELNDENGNDSGDDDEEEIVIGGGFDYVSDDDGSHDHVNVDASGNEKDDFDEIMGLGHGRGENREDHEANAQADDDDHPDSFSKINPCQADQDALRKEFPEYASCRQVWVDLKAGQMLFLPAGWFHEVTSYSTKQDGSAHENNVDNATLERCHMALNYWYHPPDALQTTDYASPYECNFWRKEEEHRLKNPSSRS